MKVFSNSARTRVNITREQAKSIKQMYKDLSKELAKEAQSLSHRDNISSKIRIQYIQGLQKQINEELNNIGRYQNSSLKANMFKVASAVVKDNQVFLNSLGININNAYSHIPSEVVTRIATGDLYKDKWNLNKAIWGNVHKTESDIDMIVAKGVAGQKSTYEIAKDLENYVNPAKRKDWQWSKVYPGTAKVVDYNAQRLARTMVSHAYQTSLLESTRMNPFVECYEWLTSNSDRVCEICMEREEGFHGVIIDGEPMNGCYYAEDLPLDHPNGMCTVDIVTPDYDDIAGRLADWVNGEEDEELDDFAEDLGYNAVTFKSKVSK